MPQNNKRTENNSNHQLIHAFSLLVAAEQQ